MKEIYQLKIIENWDRGTNHKEELFFSDYQRAFNYLRLNLYERKSGDELINVGDSELWEKDYGYQVRVYKRMLN